MVEFGRAEGWVGSLKSKAGFLPMILRTPYASEVRRHALPLFSVRWASPSARKVYLSTLSSSHLLTCLPSYSDLVYQLDLLSFVYQVLRRINFHP